MGSALDISICAPYALTAAGNTSASNFTLSTQNSKIAQVVAFRCSGTSDTITHVGFRQGTTTGTPGASSYKIGVQSVDSSGLPSGTYLGGGSPASASFTPLAANANTWLWVALDNGISVSRDDMVALVLERTATTDGSNCIDAAYAHGRWLFRPGIPYTLTHNGTSWTKKTGDGTANHPIMGSKSASAVYGWPAKNIYTTNAYGSTTEVGMFFTVPTNFCSTFKVKGIRFIGLEASSGTGTHIANIYSSPVTGTIASVSASNATDNDAFSSNESGDRYIEMFFTGTLPTLNAGTEYGVGLSTTTGSNMELAVLEAQSAADLDAWPFRQNAGFMSRTLTSYPPSGDDTANFTKTTTKRPLMELILDDLTAPSGGTTTIRGGAMFCG